MRPTWRWPHLVDAIVFVVKLNKAQSPIKNHVLLFWNPCVLFMWSPHTPFFQHQLLKLAAECFTHTDWRCFQRLHVQHVDTQRRNSSRLLDRKPKHIGRLGAIQHSGHTVREGTRWSPGGLAALLRYQQLFSELFKLCPCFLFSASQLWFNQGNNLYTIRANSKVKIVSLDPFWFSKNNRIPQTSTFHCTLVLCPLQFFSTVCTVTTVGHVVTPPCSSSFWITLCFSKLISCSCGQFYLYVSNSHQNTDLYVPVPVWNRNIQIQSTTKSWYQRKRDAAFPQEQRWQGKAETQPVESSAGWLY